VLAGQAERTSDDRLRRGAPSILNDAIRQSAWFSALMRADYMKDSETGIPTWVRKEWTEAGQANTRRRHDRMNRVAVLFGDSPKHATGSIQARTWSSLLNPTPQHLRSPSTCSPYCRYGRSACSSAPAQMHQSARADVSDPTQTRPRDGPRRLRRVTGNAPSHDHRVTDQVKPPCY
jgi:hypothetical protein